MISRIDEIVKCGHCTISLFTFYEIVSGITNEKEYGRRVKIVKELLESRIPYFNYLPIECFATAYKFDLSNFNFVNEQKNELNMIITELSCSESFDDFNKKLKMRKIDFEKYLEETQSCEKSLCERINSLLKEVEIDYRETNKKRISKPEYIKINFEDYFCDFDNSIQYLPSQNRIEIVCLKQLLYSLNVEYDNAKFNKLLNNYTGELTAFFLGLLVHNFLKIDNGSMSGRNDYLDILHLLYLRDENYKIVSSDKLFTNDVMKMQRMSLDDFKTHLSKCLK